MFHSRSTSLPPRSVEPAHVFEDATGRRRVFALGVGIVSIVGLVLVMGDFALRLNQLPALADPVAFVSAEQASAAGGPSPDQAAIHLRVPAGKPDAACDRSTGSAPGRFVAAYLPANDSTSSEALAARCDSVDLVLAQSYSLGGSDGNVVVLGAGGQRPAVPGSVPTLAVLSIPARDPGMAARVFDSQDNLARMNADLLRLEAGAGGGGLCLDLSTASELTTGHVWNAVSALRRDVVPAGRTLCLIGAADASYWDDARIVDALDLAVFAAFREPSRPADLPLSAEGFARAVALAAEKVPAEKRIIALGAGGYAWRSGQVVPERLSHTEALHQLTENEGNFTFVPEMDSNRISYVDQDRRRNDLWLADGVTFHNQLLQLGQLDGITIWPIGYEDPVIWDLIDTLPGSSASAEILTAPIDLGNMLRIEGRGQFATQVAVGVTGARVVNADLASGRIVGQSYLTIPQPDRIVLAGEAQKGELSLTFDGLPAEEDLPELMALLDWHAVEATFFVDRSAMLERGAALSLLKEHGHIIGMIYSEPRASLTSLIFGPRLIDNAAQLMIAGEVGIRTLFVRAQSDATLGSHEGVISLAAQIGSGYLPLVPGLATPDGAPDPLDKLARLGDVAGVVAGDVLRLDLGSGGSGVISALPAIMSDLAAEGYRLRPLRSALELSHDVVMPVATVVPLTRDKVVFGFLWFTQYGLGVVFLSLMLFAALRSLAFLGLALWRNNRTDFDREFHPPVSIIVPAYNEENVIERCINSLLEQDYPDLDIIVVDDGSTDRTAQIVEEKFGDHPRVRLLMQENGGKWRASNLALTFVTSPYFVIADADSLFLPDTISWLVQQFRDESVGAVAGLVEVGNHEGLLSDFQRIEYIVSQNVMRRAYETFEGILVVPGAVGAWRTEAVLRAREFSGETLTEDADLTVAVHRAGYRVRFQEQARSVTEAPATIRGFMRQRLRWTFGMLQVSWKHRRAISERRAVGLISIIDSIIFGTISSILSPLVDVLLVIIAMQAVFSLATGAELGLSGFPTIVLLSYLALTVIDMLNTLAAFWFERRFNLKLLLLVPLLRFGYRQLLYISTLRAIWHALTGRMAMWNKLERSGVEFAESFRRSPSDRQIMVGEVVEIDWSGSSTRPQTPEREMQI